MFSNFKPNELIALLATLDPVSQAAGSVLTAWIPLRNFESVFVQLQTGALGASATVDAKLRKATDRASGGRACSSRAHGGTFCLATVDALGRGAIMHATPKGAGA